MCGLFASVNFSPKRDFIQDLLQHRGPDGFGHARVQNVDLFHARLSITGASGRQPFSDPDSNAHFIVNGEFYDYHAIKSKRPYNYSLDCDSEILAPLYRDFGVTSELFQQLNGEFSFVIFDPVRRQLHLARDRFGVKPLYYAFIGSSFAVASEAKMLTPFVGGKWNDSTLRKVLGFQYHEARSSLFEGIHQVPPGCVLTLNTDTLAHQVTSYWDMFEEQQNDVDEFSTSKERVLSELSAAVKRRTDVQQPIAYTVSGGIDSSAILALGEKPRGSAAFSVSFEGGGQYDELKLAEEMAGFAGTRFNPIVVNETNLVDAFESAITASEGVSINSHVAAKHLMFEEIRKQGFKISLSGEGADEVFGGYAHFGYDMGFEDSSHDHLKGIHLPSDQELSSEGFLKALGHVPTFARAKLSMGRKMHSLLSEAYVDGFQKDIDEMLGHYRFDQGDRLSRSSYLWIKTCFANYILNTLGDRLEMRHSLEGRLPFLDPHLVSFANTLSSESKINAQGEKYILRETLRDQLPSNIINKKKQPFISPPLINWQTNGSFLDMISDILSDDFFKHDRVFKREPIVKLVKGIQKNPEAYAHYDNVLMIILSIYFLDKNIVNGPRYAW